MSFQYLRDENRVGQFGISSDRLFDESTFTALSQCIIVRAERRFFSGDIVEYEAFHPDMVEVPDGITWPVYHACLDANGKLTFMDFRLSYPDDWTCLWLRKRKGAE